MKHHLYMLIVSSSPACDTVERVGKRIEPLQTTDTIFIPGRRTTLMLK
jgi:hypothetical protein